MTLSLIILALFAIMTNSYHKPVWASLGGGRDTRSKSSDHFDKFRHNMKVKWSGMGMTDGSGKIGGNVAAKNRFGSYLRRRGQVINPQTTLQQASRMAFGALSQLWRAITDAQRAAWRALTADVPSSDAFGDSVKLTGAQLFVKFNKNLALCSIGSIDDAPVLGGAAEIVNLTPIVDIGAGATNAVDVTINNSNGTASASSLIIEATPPVSAGRSAGSIKNRFRFLILLAGQGAGLDGNSTIVSADFTTGIGLAYATLFGVPAEGQKIFFRVSAINNDTGERSPIMQAETIVLNTP